MAFRELEERLRILESKNGELLSALLEAQARTVPTAAVEAFAGAAAPAGWLPCHGQAVSRTTYAALFAVIGTFYGAGNGTTTFNLPDLRGRVPVGLDATQTEFNVSGKTGGAKTHTLTVAEMPSHFHSPAAIVDVTPLKWGVGSVNGSGNGYLSNNGAGNNNTLTGSTGGGSAHNNLQPYMALNYIIRT